MADKIELTREQAIQTALLLRRFDGYFDAVRPRFDKFANYYEAFKFYRDPDSHAYKYNISKPFIFTMVMAFVAQILNTIYERSRVFDVTPTEGTHFFRPDINDEAIAKQMQKALNIISLNPDYYLYDETQDFVTGLGIYGSAVAQTLPVFDSNNVWIGSKTQYIDVWDFIPKPRTYLLGESQDFFTREVIDKDELEVIGKQRGYKNLSKVDENTVIPDDIKNDLFSKMGLSDLFDDGFSKDGGKGNILLIHWHKNGHIVTMAGNKVIVKDTRDPIPIETPDGSSINVKLKPYPYFPFDMVKLNPAPKEFYGIGIAEAAKQYQENSNLRGSQRNENIELALMKTFLVNYLFDIDPENIVMGAGNIMLTNDINNSVKVLDVPDITSSSYNEDQVEKFEAQDALGINEALRGSFNKVRTATTDTIAQRAGQRRMQVVLRSMSNLYKSVGKKTILQMHTWLPKEKYERMIGEPDAGFYNMTQEEIALFWDISPTSTGLDLLGEQTKAELVQFYQVAIQQPDIVNRPELLKHAIKEFFPNVNPDKFVLQQQQGAFGGGQPPGIVPPGSPSAPGIGEGNFSPQQLLAGGTNG